jgi:hypothetical protein
MFFFQTFMTNFVLTKSSGPKSHAVAFTALIFAGFCVCHTGLSGGGEGAGLYVPVPIRVGRGKIYPPQPMTHIPPPCHLCGITHLSGWTEARSTFGAIQTFEEIRGG